MKIGERDIITIAITGTIGSGKTLTGKMLEELGVPVIDTDKIVHELLLSDTDVKNEIEEKFPTAIKHLPDENAQMIDRKVLAKMIFTDKEAKTKLEAIMHPRVRVACKQRTIEIASKPINVKAIATLVPLLFEARRQSDYDQVWALYCDEKVLRQRIAKRDGFSEEEINLRLAAQWTQLEKCKLANKVLDNSGDENNLLAQILKNLQDLKLSSPGLNNSLTG